MTIALCAETYNTATSSNPKLHVKCRPWKLVSNVFLMDLLFTFIYQMNFYCSVVVFKSLAVMELEARVLPGIKAIYFADSAVPAGACTIICAVHE
jgi:hypothetical protein